jgi:glycosyltransferase involved in cell wall biosynthesis
MTVLLAITTPPFTRNAWAQATLHEAQHSACSARKETTVMPVDVSIIIPTFRRPAQLAEAIRSALRQEWVTIEVLVLDDSPEGSARAVVNTIGHPRVHYHQRREPSGGRPALVRNEGVPLSKGRYVHFLDDDDRLAPGASAALVSALDHNRQAGVAWGHVVPFGDDPQALNERVVWFERAAALARTQHGRYRTVATILFKGTLMVNSACMIRRSCFGALRGFDPELQVYEDVDFWMRAFRTFNHVFVDRPVLEYRTGASSLSHDLGGDWGPVRACYHRIHHKYRAEHGVWEYAMLNLYARFLPPVAPPRSTQ